MEQSQNKGMKSIKLLLIVFSVISVTACGQNKNQNSDHKNRKKIDKMDTGKITNQNVKQAFEAWQSGDSKTFLSFFTDNPTMTDDGSPRNFQSYVKEACGKEVFLTIDSVENDDKNITGNFKAGPWGTFPVFFNFHQNAEGKFERLDIGQAK